MIVDAHVHVLADTPTNGRLSDRLRKQLNIRLLRWRLGLPTGPGAAFEQAFAARLVQTISEAKELDAAVVLALDTVFDNDGRRDDANTHLHVANDYVAALAARHPKILFGASVHPYRPDALAELERCIRQGAVLLKWLPVVQDFSPADPRCVPLYEALAHHRLPLLCHTGGEYSLPSLDMAAADPALLEPALRLGVTVIAAHCGTRSAPAETDYLPAFVRLAKEYEHCYGDMAALNLPSRSYAYPTLLDDEGVRRKLVHGSDWPILPIPPRRIGWLQAARLLATERNWLRRDVRIKQSLGLGDDYWARGATLLRRQPGEPFSAADAHQRPA